MFLNGNIIVKHEHTSMYLWPRGSGLADHDGVAR